MVQTTYINLLDPKTCLVKVVKRKDEKVLRESKIEVAKRYIIIPINPQKKKNRNRKCIVAGFIDQGRVGVFAVVKFLDNGRCGKIDMSELMPADDLNA